MYQKKDRQRQRQTKRKTDRQTGKKTDRFQNFPNVVLTLLPRPILEY